MAFDGVRMTEQEIRDYRPRIGTNERATQAVRPIPIVVDVGVEKVLGKAILDAINNDPNLHAAINDEFSERDVLDNIVSLEFWRPAADITLLAYPGAPVHTLIALANEITYFAAVQSWRMNTSGSSGLTLNVLFAL